MAYWQQTAAFKIKYSLNKYFFWKSTFSTTIPKAHSILYECVLYECNLDVLQYICHVVIVMWLDSISCNSKCPLNAHFRISLEVVFPFCLLYYEYCEFGHEKEAFVSWVACLACIDVQEVDHYWLPQYIREIIV